MTAAPASTVAPRRARSIATRSRRSQPDEGLILRPDYPVGVRRAVFLDRDDTLVECRAVTPDGDLGDPALVRLLAGACEACQSLAEAGFTLVVVSNQGGVARGRYDEDAVRSVNARVNELLGGAIRAFYFCPYHPRGTVDAYRREHPNRKPQPGMLLQAATDLGIDLEASWMVGDQPRDCQAGKAAGCRTVLVAREKGLDASDADVVVSGPGEAAEAILRAMGSVAGHSSGASA